MREYQADGYGEELCLTCDMTRDEWWRLRALLGDQRVSACEKAKKRIVKTGGFTGEASRR